MSAAFGGSNVPRVALCRLFRFGLDHVQLRILLPCFRVPGGCGGLNPAVAVNNVIATRPPASGSWLACSRYDAWSLWETWLGRERGRVIC